MQLHIVRNNFVGTMEKVCSNHAPVIITRKNAEAVIMMSLDDYNAMMETVYLLRSPKNAAVFCNHNDDIRILKGNKDTITI